MGDFEKRLDDFLAEFSPDNQERILRYALDHALPRMKARRAQPAQVGQVLTRDEIEEAFQQAAGADDETHIRFARAIEQAVLAKRVPMTLSQIIRLTDEIPLHEGGGWFVDVVRAAERHHGIIGEKGGA